MTVTSESQPSNGSIGETRQFPGEVKIIGGAVNLGLNADRNQAGQVSYTVYILFIAIQAAGPFVALLLNKPDKVQRKDGKKVSLEILQNPWFEMKKTARLFLTKKFLLIVPFIGQAVFAEAVFFTYLSLWFSVRARALGSFVGGLAAIITGNLLGYWIDRTNIPLKRRTRLAFAVIVTLQDTLLSKTSPAEMNLKSFDMPLSFEERNQRGRH
ncbi:hypothetical protein SLS63_007917 [Diaporthe eres]|uniref:Major facilitator superfamily transporter n=1 Tax=Diaporthe eres TaxID=83184 RepID=A0ABR1P4F5_DIAER